jgi:hypothetical protein
MFGSAILDVAIGLIFVFLLVSLMVTAVTELLAGWRKWRAKTLWSGLVNLLDDPGKTGWTEILYAHPLIQGMSPPPKKGPTAPEGGKNGPSYIPPSTFALALLDVVRDDRNVRDWMRRELAAAVAGLGDPKAAATRQAIGALSKVAGLGETMAGLLAQAEAAGSTPETLRAGAAALVAALPDSALVDAGNARLEESRLGRALAVLEEEAGGDAERLKAGIVRWFDNGMDRVSGWYKRHTQLVHVLLATALTLGINVDSILIVQHLATDTALRSSLVAQAQAYARENRDPAQTDQNLAALEARLQQVDLPVGWKLDPGAPPSAAKLAAQPATPSSASIDRDLYRRTLYYDPGHLAADFAYLGSAVLFHLWGWLLTAIAVSLGAPFWFDILNKVITIRAAGKAPGEVRPAAPPTTTIALTTTAPGPQPPPSTGSA